MCHAIGLKCLKSFEIKQRLDIAVARRVAIVDRQHVGPRRLGDLRLRLERILESLHDELAADVGVAEPQRQALGKSPLEAVMIEHRPEHEAAQAWIIGYDRLRFLANAVPDRVDSGDLRRSDGGGNVHGTLLLRLPTGAKGEQTTTKASLSTIIWRLA